MKERVSINITTTIHIVVDKEENKEYDFDTLAEARLWLNELENRRISCYLYSVPNLFKG
jgi:hypothetical protein